MTHVDDLWPGHLIAQYALTVDDDLLARHRATLGQAASGDGPLPASVFAAQPFTLGPKTVPPRWKGALTVSYRLTAHRPATIGESVDVATVVSARSSDDVREYLTTQTTVVGQDGLPVCTAEVVTCWFLNRMAGAPS